MEQQPGGHRERRIDVELRAGVADLCDVLATCEHPVLSIDDERKTQLIDDLIPRPLHRPFRAFAGIRGTLNYDKFEDGSLRYLSAQLRKEAG